MPLERSQVMQVTDDRWIVARPGPIARADAPGGRAQLVGRRLDWIQAGE
jgi:hypothetical protein